MQHTRVTRRRALALGALSPLACALNTHALPPNTQTAKPIVVHSREDATARYALTVFEMAMHKAQAPYELSVINQSKPAIALRRMLKAGQTDLIWAATSEQLETDFIPVRIPLYKGLMGYRTLLIQPGSQARFDGVKTLEDLKAFKLGQVHSWADTQILEANNLDILRVTRHVSLFNKLRKGAIDAAPRALFETLREQQLYPEFTQERNLLLHYPLPMYFFVSRDNPELAHQLTYGLSKAVRDGSLDVLLYRQSEVKEAIAALKAHERHVIRLENPYLPAKTPTDNPQLWLQLS